MVREIPEAVKLEVGTSRTSPEVDRRFAAAFVALNGWDRSAHKAARENRAHIDLIIHREGGCPIG